MAIYHLLVSTSSRGVVHAFNNSCGSIAALSHRRFSRLRQLALSSLENASFDTSTDSQTFASSYHAPVMYRECISALMECKRGKSRLLRNDENEEDQHDRLIFVDGTLGGGGHSLAILESLKPQDILIGCDRDPAALKTASERLNQYIKKGMFIPHQSNFRDLASSLKTVEDFNGDLLWDKGDIEVDGLLLDLGVSSHQIDCAERGFSFSKDGPLDMRMDGSSTSTQALTASDICNEWDEKSLTDILRMYGDEPRAKKIARSIIERRPYETTTDLINAVKAVTPEFAKKSRRLGQKATLARVFQSMRMVVNEEDTSLSDALVLAAPNVVRPGGRLVVLTYHSLEDRATKRIMKDGHERWISPMTNDSSQAQIAWVKVISINFECFCAVSTVLL